MKDAGKDPNSKMLLCHQAVTCYPVHTTFIAGLVLSAVSGEKAFLPHDFMSCPNAILMKDCDVALWQNQ